ncbi:MAG: signal recognition particle subunit SRP19/SEC65 family protein [Thermoplasmata archaeon]
MTRKRKTWVIYPEYFDKNLTRNQCRRVPIDKSISSPTLDEISQILDDYNIPNRVEKHQHHPSTWHKRNGRILISKQNVPKQKFLVMVGDKLKKRRHR